MLDDLPSLLKIGDFFGLPPPALETDDRFTDSPLEAELLLPSVLANQDSELPPAALRPRPPLMLLTEEREFIVVRHSAVLDM